MIESTLAYTTSLLFIVLDKSFYTDFVNRLFLEILEPKTCPPFFQILAGSPEFGSITLLSSAGQSRFRLVEL